MELSLVQECHMIENLASFFLDIIIKIVITSCIVNTYLFDVRLAVIFELV